jgi:hypothetical protein
MCLSDCISGDIRMIWRSEKHDARVRFDSLAYMLRSAGKSFEKLHLIIPLYEDADIRNLIEPGSRKALKHDQGVARALYKMLREAGAEVWLVSVSVIDYTHWLGDHQNTPERWASYLSALAQTEVPQGGPAMSSGTLDVRYELPRVP